MFSVCVNMYHAVEYSSKAKKKKKQAIISLLNPSKSRP